MRRDIYQYSVLVVLGEVCAFISGASEIDECFEDRVEWLKWRVNEGWYELEVDKYDRHALVIAAYEEAIRLACIAAIEAYEVSHVRGD